MLDYTYFMYLYNESLRDMNRFTNSGREFVHVNRKLSDSSLRRVFFSPQISKRSGNTVPRGSYNRKFV